MIFRSIFLGGTLAATLSLPAFACDLHGAMTRTAPEARPMQMVQNGSGDGDHSGHAMSHDMGLDGPIMVREAYARTSRPGAPTAAAFMAITNTSEMPDRLIDVRSDIAARVELHTHQEDGDGVMKMMHVEEGFEIGAGETVLLARGGKHVMFMGLNQNLQDGATVPVTLVFETAGEVVLDVVVDSARKPAAGAHGGHEHSLHGDS